MIRFLLAILFLLISIPAHALSLRWDAVTNDSTGAPLGPSLVVTQYLIYRCNTPATNCVKANASVIGSVNAPVTTFSLTGQVFPASYFVTAVNIVEESPESGTVKVTPPDRPRNENLQNP